MRRTVVALALAAAAVGTTAGTQAVAASPAEAPSAERWAFYDSDGFYCEGNIEYPLGKVVCRNPARFAQYRVAYFDFDERNGVVFMDAFASTPRPGIFDIRQEQISFAEFRRRYGR